MSAFDQFDEAPVPVAPDAPPQPAPLAAGGNLFDMFDTPDAHAPPGPATPVPYWTDVGKAAGQGMINGAADIAGAPMTIAGYVENAPGWLIGQGARLLGYPETAKTFLDEYGGANNDSGTPWLDALTRPDATQLTRLINSRTNPDHDPAAYQPQTVTGKLTEAGVEGAAAGLAFGGGTGLLAKGADAILGGALPGMASETAGQLTQGTALEPYARVGAALLTGAPRAVMAARTAPGRILGQQLNDLPVSVAKQAQDLMDKSYQMGAPLTLPEAVQFASGGATNLDAIARVVEQNGPGAGIMKRFYAGRPQSNADLVESTLGQIGPEDAGVWPSSGPNTSNFDIPPRVAAAATAVVRGAEQDRSNATRPFYTAANPQQVPAPHVESILQDIDQTIAADRTGILGRGGLAQMRGMLTETPATPGQPAVAGTPGRYVNGTCQPATPGTPAVPAQPRVPVTDIENLDRARKYLRDSIDLPNFAVNATDKESAARLIPQLDRLRAGMVDASPSFAEGNATHAAISQGTVQPLYNSPTGQLAATATLTDPVAQYGRQASILFDPNPVPGSDRAVARAVAAVAAEDPDAAASLVRMKLQQVWNEAGQDNMTGPNQNGGAKFAAWAAGNPQQAKNLQAAVTALPNGQAAWASLNDAFDNFRAQGTRLAPNSSTNQNQLLTAQLRKGTPAEGLAADVGSPSKWTSFLSDKLAAYRYGQNTTALANIFTSQDALRQARALAATGAGTPAFQAGLNAALLPLLLQGGNQYPNAVR